MGGRGGTPRRAGPYGLGLSPTRLPHVTAARTGVFTGVAPSRRIAPMSRLRSQRSRSRFPALRLLLAAAAAGSAALVAAAPAAAQDGQDGQGGLQPPTPNPPLHAPSNATATAVGIGLLILIVGANGIPSKRGHQD